MNVTEAIHVQALLIWLTDRHLTGDQGTDAARESAAVLAAAARRRLGAGPTPDQIHAAWDDLLTTCPGCPTCTPTTGQADGQDDTSVQHDQAGGDGGEHLDQPDDRHDDAEQRYWAAFCPACGTSPCQAMHGHHHDQDDHDQHHAYGQAVTGAQAVTAG